MQRFVLCGCLSLLVVASGCSGKKTSDPSDPEEARALLKETLEAWQQGATPNDMKSRQPSVHVADDDWLAGAKLLRFQVVDQGAVVGTSLRCTVEIEVESQKAGRVTQQVGYQVSTQPSRSVVRSEGRGRSND